MASLVVREEPLLKQLVRSRTLRSSSAVRGSIGGASRSSSQPPPLSRSNHHTSSSSGGPSSPNFGPSGDISSKNVTYTLQFLPYNVVYPKNNKPASSHLLSLSQPDLSKLYTQSPSIYSPPVVSHGGSPFFSRESSPLRSISSSLRNSLINLDSTAWPSLASNSVVLPMTDAPLIRVDDGGEEDDGAEPPFGQQQQQQGGILGPNGNSNGATFCQMCYLLNKPSKVRSSSPSSCNACSRADGPLSILDKPGFCMVGSPKPPETAIYVNGCDVINNNNHSSSSTGGARAANHFIVEGHQSTPTPGGGGGNVFASYNGGCSSNGHLPYHQHLHHHQQRLHRYHSRPGSSGPGISRLTSRGVSPSKERPSSSHEGAHLLASFVSRYCPVLLQVNIAPN